MRGLRLALCWVLAVCCLGCEAWGILVFEPEIPPFQARYRADIILEDVSGMSLREDGTWSVQVRLSQQPKGSVLIPVNVSDEGEATASVNSLVFEPLTWNVAQEVVLTGVDDREKDGNQQITLTLGPGTSTQERFDGVDAVEVSLAVVDGVCGNGVLDGEEGCEPGSEETACVYGVQMCKEECSASCQLEAPVSPGYCGDGVVQSAEEDCDEPLSPCAYGEQACIVCDACLKVSGVPSGYCGDGVVQEEFGEACDGDVASPVSCHSLGLAGGTVTGCTETCALDTTACYKLVDIAVAYGRSCALSERGDLYCWGENEDGGLGDGGFTQSPLPQKIPGLSAVQAVTLGTNHICAVVGEGEVFCWGENNRGQLGNGTLIDTSSPVQVSGISDARDVEAGWYHTCVLRRSGRVSCWGWNNGGQLGNETTEDSAVPVEVVGLEQVQELASTSFGMCALLQNGQVYCWGYTVPRFEEGIDISLHRLGDLNDVTNIYGHGPVICMESASLGVHCFGANDEGQFGDGSTTTLVEPVHAPHLDGAQHYMSSLYHACAVMGDGTVKCWGDNKHGQLGDGSLDDSQTPGDALVLTSQARRVAVSSSHSCALLDNGAVHCWGNNALGQLGSSDATVGATPQEVPGLSSVRHLAAGWNHTCALLFDGKVWCWGSNHRGLLGNGGEEDSAIPVEVPSLDNVRSLDVGASHTCAVRQQGDVWCWGRNSYGELGDRSLGDRNRPVQVANITNAVAVTLGGEHSCALRSDGTVVCWGANYFGQVRVDLGSFITRATLLGLPDIVSVGAGRYHSCALLQDRHLRCWGYSGDGQVGVGSDAERIPPSQVQQLGTIQDYSVGAYHNCALEASGGLFCWGLNANGQLGNNSTADRLSPTEVPGFLNTSSLSLGWFHSCASTLNGDAYCWGLNSNGQLGDDSLLQKNNPSLVVGLSGVVELAAGAIHTCARMQDNTVQCWGSNLHGRLGRPFSNSIPTPTRTDFP